MSKQLCETCVRMLICSCKKKLDVCKDYIELAKEPVDMTEITKKVIKAVRVNYE